MRVASLLLLIGVAGAASCARQAAVVGKRQTGIPVWGDVVKAALA